jgi:hypothetical protein
MCAGLRSAQLKKKKVASAALFRTAKKYHDAQITKNLVLDQGVVDSHEGGKRVLYATLTNSSQVKGSLDFSEKSHLTLSGALTQSQVKCESLGPS